VASPVSAFPFPIQIPCSDMTTSFTIT
jgi:hypothetical protein